VTKREVKQLLFQNLKATRDQLDWVLKSPNDKVMVNRIGVLPYWVRLLIFNHLMPASVRGSLNRKYPGRMEVR
jgi:hypothetical protein